MERTGKPWRTTTETGEEEGRGEREEGGGEGEDRGWRGEERGKIEGGKEGRMNKITSHNPLHCKVDGPDSISYKRSLDPYPCHIKNLDH